MRKRCFLMVFVWGACAVQGFAQSVNLDVVKVQESHQPYAGESIYIPDIPGYKTLKCDFHTHTIFSDGDVKPENRVWEAAARGLDVIAITDHIEYRPHPYVVGDHNESYRRAKAIEPRANVLVVHGAEITRSKPLGHLNALFLEDANALDVEDPLVAIDNALKQGAFVMWNHPGWPNDTTTLYDVHAELIAQHKIHGVELVNGFEYYPKAFTFCDRYGLTCLGNTDIHGVYQLTYRSGYAPMTIAFATERSVAGVKEALFQGRTFVKFGDLLIGSEENLRRLLKACLTCEVEKNGGGVMLVKVSNQSSLRFDISLDSKALTLQGNTSLSFTVMPQEHILFTNLSLLSGGQLKLNAFSLQ